MAFETDLVGYWPLVDNGQDNFGANHFGVSVAAAAGGVFTEVAGFKCLKIQDSSAQSMETTSPLLAPAGRDMTWGFWLYLDDAVANVLDNHWAGSDNIWNISTVAASTDAAEFRVILDSGPPNSFPDSPHPKRKWQYELFTFRDFSASFVRFVNGAFVGVSFDGNPLPSAFVNNLRLGDVSGAGTYHAMYGLRIWNRRLNGDEIIEAYREYHRPASADRAVSIRPPSYKQTNIKAMSDIYNRNLPEQYEYLFGHDIRFYQGGGR